ncbi:CdaR family protein [Fundidesulfovibrio butyratiphilus]
MGGETVNSNWFYRALALFLAVFCWYLVTGRERVDSWVRVKVEMTGLPDSLMLRGTLRDHIDVLLRGPKGLVRKVEPGSLIYTVDARQVTAGVNTVVVEPGKLPVAKLFEVVEVRPQSLELVVEKRGARAVPVRLVFKDGLARDYKLTATVEPQTVTVTGPESVVQGVREAPTQPLGLPSDPSGHFDAPVSLVLPEQTEAQPRTVKAQVTYQQLTRETSVEVPLRVLYAGRKRVNATPDSVTLRIKAPLLMLREGGWRGLFDAYLEVPAEAPAGRQEKGYRVTLPQGFELLEAKPEKATIVIK